jgi:hypothetical protein
MAGALSTGTWATLGALPRLLLTWLVISCLAFTSAGTVYHLVKGPLQYGFVFRLKTLISSRNCKFDF